MNLREALAAATPSEGRTSLRLAFSEPEGVLTAIQIGNRVLVWNRERRAWLDGAEYGNRGLWSPAIALEELPEFQAGRAEALAAVETLGLEWAQLSLKDVHLLQSIRGKGMETGYREALAAIRQEGVSP